MGCPKMVPKGNLLEMMSNWQTSIEYEDNQIMTVTTFATEEAKVSVHSSLLLLLGQLAILSEFRREVRLIAVGRAGGWLSGVV